MRETTPQSQSVNPDSSDAMFDSFSRQELRDISHEIASSFEPVVVLDPELVVLPVDPGRIHAYWALPQRKPDADPLVLRVRGRRGPVFDVDVYGEVGNSYVDLWDDTRAVEAVLGERSAAGFRPLATCPEVQLPDREPRSLGPVELVDTLTPWVPPVAEDVPVLHAPASLIELRFDESEGSATPPDAARDSESVRTRGAAESVHVTVATEGFGPPTILGRFHDSPFVETQVTATDPFAVAFASPSVVALGEGIDGSESYLAAERPSDPWHRELEFSVAARIHEVGAADVNVPSPLSTQREWVLGPAPLGSGLEPRFPIAAASNGSPETSGANVPRGSVESEPSTSTPPQAGIPTRAGWGGSATATGSAKATGSATATGSLSSFALARSPTVEVRAELHVYGRAEPGRELLLYGHRVHVGADGSFSLRRSVPVGWLGRPANEES